MVGKVPRLISSISINSGLLAPRMGMKPEMHEAPHDAYQDPCTKYISGFSHHWSVEMKFGDGQVKVTSRPYDDHVSDPSRCTA